MHEAKARKESKGMSKGRETSEDAVERPGGRETPMDADEKGQKGRERANRATKTSKDAVEKGQWAEKAKRAEIRPRTWSEGPRRGHESGGSSGNERPAKHTGRRTVVAKGQAEKRQKGASGYSFVWPIGTEGSAGVARRKRDRESC